MLRRPPLSTLSGTPFPPPTVFLSIGTDRAPGIDAVEQPRRLLRSEIVRHRAALLEAVGRHRQPAGLAEYLHLVGDKMFAVLEPRAHPQEIVPLLLGERRLERRLDDLPILRIARRSEEHTSELQSLMRIA